jgi:serine/threonine-protein kinase
VGKPVVREGLLNSGQPTVFSMNLPVGHKLRATLASTHAGATMNILAPNQANVDVYAKNTLNWEGNLPLAGEYRIEIVPLPGAASSNYKLEIAMSASAPVTAPTPGAALTPPTSMAPIPTVSTTPAPVGR